MARSYKTKKLFEFDKGCVHHQNSLIGVQANRHRQVLWYLFVVAHRLASWVGREPARAP